MRSIRLFIVSIYVSCSITLIAQESEQYYIDSLTEVLETTTIDTVRINTLLELVGSYYSSNPDTAILLSERGRKLSEKVNYELGMSESYGWLGYLYTAKGAIEKAQEYNLKSLELIKKGDDKESLATIYINIGTIYSRQGKISDALTYYHLALKIQEESNDKKGIAHTLTSIGLVYKYQNDIPLALEFYKKSLKMWNEVGDEYGIGLTLNNIGVIYYENGDYTTAMDYYQQGLALRMKLNNKSGIANSLCNIGNIYEIREEYPKALEYYDEALVLQEEIGEKSGICQTVFNMAISYFKMKNNDVAEALALRSYKIAKELGYPYRIHKSAELLSKIYWIKKDYKRGWEMYELHIVMRDSILNEETQKEYLQQEFQYAFEKQALTDSLAGVHKDLEIKEQQAIIKKDETQRFALFGGLFLMLILVVVSVRGYIRKRKDNELIKEQKSEVEKQKDEIELQHLKLEETHQEIADSINYAKRIQNAILPPKKLIKEHLKDSFILYKPKDIVAGDFYWLEASSVLASSQGEDKVLFAAADCTGHGVPGAMVSVVCNNALNRSVREYGLTDPGKILDKTRDIVIQEFEKSEDEVKDGMDIALCSLEFLVPCSLSSGSKEQRTVALLQYAGAHNPLWLIRNGEIIETKANKQPIGKFDKMMPYTTRRIDLQKRDTIYIFSDGYVDQFGGDRGKKFKAKAFRELLLSIQDKPMDEQKEIIDQTFETWRGDLEQIDDVCVIGVRV